MTDTSVTGPSARLKWIAGVMVVVYAVVTLMPLLWIIATGFKSGPDSIAYPPKVVFAPSLEGYVNLFTTQTRQSAEYLAANPPQTWYEEIVHDKNMVITGPSRFGERFLNSVIIGFGSTFLSVFLGTLAAYAFSRFRVPLRDDLMFFILSTRMMPPVAISIPIFLMFRSLGLSDTHAGMILLYTAVNLSLAVWLLKGFIDEIPREYEEAALIDGYTRFQAFTKVVLPQAATGIASTAIFCLIFRVERIRLRGSSDLGQRADGAALHPDHHRHGRARLARGGGRRDHLPVAGHGLHHPAAQAPVARDHLRSGAQMREFLDGLKRLRRGPWEMVATVLIALGVLMLMQPFVMWAYTLSFLVTLAGTVMFLIVSHFRE